MTRDKMCYSTVSGELVRLVENRIPMCFVKYDDYWNLETRLFVALEENKKLKHVLNLQSNVSQEDLSKLVELASAGAAYKAFQAGKNPAEAVAEVLSILLAANIIKQEE